MPKHDLSLPKSAYNRAKQYATTHRDDALICAAFVVVLLALLIIP
jgi:hypothetical protein